MKTAHIAHVCASSINSLYYQASLLSLLVGKLQWEFRATSLGAGICAGHIWSQERRQRDQSGFQMSCAGALSCACAAARDSSASLPLPCNTSKKNIPGFFFPVVSNRYKLQQFLT